jgi:RNA polymerase sigma factor (TIGR02999 family)
MDDVTQILSAIEQNDSLAVEKLLPLLYDELRKLAAAKLSQEKPGQTLDATALVHEAYLKLLGPAATRQPWTSRGHFFAAAATAMRRILIDNARRKQAQKRGGGWQRQELEAIVASEADEDLLALDSALEKLAVKDPQKAKLIELRYFAGLTGEEAAKALGISATTADRHWTYARAWLRAEIRGQ